MNQYHVTSFLKMTSTKHEKVSYILPTDATMSNFLVTMVDGDTIKTVKLTKANLIKTFGISKHILDGFKSNKNRSVAIPATK